MEITAVVTDCVRKLQFFMHLDVYEPVWFKCGMIIDTMECYIFVCVKVILTFIQGHRSVRKLQPVHQLSHRVFT